LTGQRCGESVPVSGGDRTTRRGRRGRHDRGGGRRARTSFTAILNEHGGGDGARGDDTDRRTSSKYRPSIQWGSVRHNVTL